MSLHIFFSHGSADREWVQQIAASIETGDVKVYLYERDSRPGHLVTTKLHNAIAASHIVLVLLTRHSCASAYVQQEIGFAEGKGKLIIPLVGKGVPKRALAMLDGREYVPFDAEAIDGCIAALTECIVNQVATRPDKTFAGLALNEWMGVLAAILVMALGAYLLYSITSEK